jgi:hypothetical protein
MFDLKLFMTNNRKGNVYEEGIDYNYYNITAG